MAECTHESDCTHCASKFLTSELIRSKVNVHGELHLDAKLTQLLLKLIEADEKFASEMQRHIAELTELMRPLLRGSHE